MDGGPDFWLATQPFIPAHPGRRQGGGDRVPGPGWLFVRPYDRKAEHFQAFADLACALLAYGRLLKATT